MAEDEMRHTDEAAQQVALQSDHEVHGWMQSFGCSEEALRRAVAEVGVSAADVRSWLGR
ncbi:MAG: DUF3606 domain-containing protein [Polaromonas sp.]|nr:DUF3606 domain-containing protein [Polaromonas sp.]